MLIIFETLEEFDSPQQINQESRQTRNEINTKPKREYISKIENPTQHSKHDKEKRHKPKNPCKLLHHGKYSWKDCFNNSDSKTGKVNQETEKREKNQENRSTRKKRDDKILFSTEELRMIINISDSSDSDEIEFPENNNSDAWQTVTTRRTKKNTLDTKRGKNILKNSTQLVVCKLRPSVKRSATTEN